MENMTYAEALRASMRKALAEDENVFLIGEDIGKYGGCYGVTAGLVEEFGEERVIDTPISELAITGASVGAAMQGKRPVVEIMYADFLTVAADQIINQACKMRYIMGKEVKVPLVVRTAYGGGGRYSFSESGGHVHECSRPDDSDAVHTRGRKGTDDGGDPQQQSGIVF